MSVQVPKGYKQTEVGMIPEDWTISPIGDVATTGSGTTPSRALYERYFKNGNINWIKTLDLNNSVIKITDEQVTEFALNETSLKIYPINTVLIAMYGGFNQIGRTGILAVPACVNQALTAVKVSSKISPKYLLYTLNYKNEYWKSVASSSRKDPNITSKDVKDFLLAFPCPKEQQAIAEALSDADALIESLEQLIAKKRQIKQGAIQELLTGKRRLPGFSGEWEVKKIDEIADCLDYLRIPINDSERRKIQGDYPYCGANGILDYIDKYCIDDDVVLIAEDGGYFGEYATRPIAYRMKGKFWVNNHVHILKSKSNFDQLYLYYSLVHKNILPFLASGTRAKLNKSEMSKITIHQPINKVEQTAIASILSDIDSEIASLDSRLAKARQIKQSMMQELLTGRIRLI